MGLFPFPTPSPFLFTHMLIPVVYNGKSHIQTCCRHMYRVMLNIFCVHTIADELKRVIQVRKLFYVMFPQKKYLRLKTFQKFRNQPLTVDTFPCLLIVIHMYICQTYLCSSAVFCLFTANVSLCSLQRDVALAHSCLKGSGSIIHLS